MNVVYSQIEQEIVAWLAPLTNGGGVQVEQLPQLQAEFDRPFLKGRITVAYKSSDFGDVINTHHIVQDEKIQVELIIQSRKLRDADGLHAMTEAVKRRLVGFKPTDCSKMYIVKHGFTNHDNQTALWQYSMIFETKYRLIEDAQYNTEQVLTQTFFEYNEELPAIPAVPFPGTFPQPPVVAYKGDLAYWDGEVWRRLHPGEPGYVLATMGEGEVPEWVEPQSGPQGPRGEQGPAGADGAQGPAGADGADGAPGADGLSAYEVAVDNGFVGTELEWLASLEGPQGPAGADGADGADGAQGPQGETGSPGPAGADGLPGATGPQGPAGPTAVSANAGNQASLGTDGLLYVGGLIKSLPLVQGSNVTGTTAITISASLLIPANKIVLNSVIKIEARAIRVSGTASIIFCQVYKNTTNSLSGATLIATYSAMTFSNYFSGITRNIFIDTSANQMTLMNAGVTLGHDYQNIGTNTVVTFDETVDNYILFALQTTNAGDTGKIQFVHATIHE